MIRPVYCCYSVSVSASGRGNNGRSSASSISKFISEQPHLKMLDNHCSTMKDLHQVHAQLIKTGLAKDFVAVSRVLAFAAAHDDVHYAHHLFNHFPNPNLFAWNTIIGAFSDSATPSTSISLFIHMLFTSSHPPNRFTYPSLFKACAHLGRSHEGAQLHGRVIKLGLQNDQFIHNSILHMYLNSGYLTDARKVFFSQALDNKHDAVMWNTMIMGLAKCGHIDESRSLFDRMLCRNTVSWNSMIGGYVRQGKFNEALELFGQMQEQNFRPTEFTMVSLLNACACLGAIRQGEWIHDYLVKNKFELTSIVVTAIINMYSKCGSIDKAFQVFRDATRKGLSCWNSMILGLAMNSLEEEAIQLFSMLEFEPDDVSFLGVLMACGNSGLVDKAKDYFLLMTERYKIKPSIKHYSCMVDVLGRAGLLEDAEQLIRSMPVKPDAIIWGSLLSWSRKYGKSDMAKRAAECMTKVDSGESSSFVLMSNVYAASGHFEEAIEQRLSLKEMQLEKEPGCSSIEVNGEVHEFLAGERLHKNAEDIYRAINDPDLFHL